MIVGRETDDVQRLWSDPSELWTSSLKSATTQADRSIEIEALRPRKRQNDPFIVSFELVRDLQSKVVHSFNSCRLRSDLVPRRYCTEKQCSMTYVFPTTVNRLDEQTCLTLTVIISSSRHVGMTSFRLSSAVYRHALTGCFSF